MSAMLRRAKKAKDQVDQSLVKLRAHEWSEPLGKTLSASSKIVDTLGNFVPGASVISGALAFGATLLNPDLSMKDLQKQLKEIHATLSAGSVSEGVIELLLKGQQDIREKLGNPVGEVRDDFREVNQEMSEMFKMVGEVNSSLSGDMGAMKDKLCQTFNFVTDLRYKVSFWNFPTCSNITRSRTVSRQWMRRTAPFYWRALKTSVHTPSNCEPLPSRTWLQNASEIT